MNSDWSDHRHTTKNQNRSILISLTPLTSCVKRIAKLHQTNYLDNSLPIKGYRMGFCKHDMQVVSLYFLHTELIPISKILFPSRLYGDPLQMKYVPLWIYPYKLVLSFLCVPWILHRAVACLSNVAFATFTGNTKDTIRSLLLSPYWPDSYKIVSQGVLVLKIVLILYLFLMHEYP
jgi:hypothetical protein